MRTDKAQTILEYAVMVSLVAIALIATQLYIKRSIQGRWKQSADDIGLQYDYYNTFSETTTTTESNAISNTTLIHSTVDEGWLRRDEQINSTETKDGWEQIVK